MFKKLLFSIICLICFSSIANAQMIIPFIDTMQSFGFENYKRNGNDFYFSGNSILVLTTVDYNGNLKNSIVSFKNDNFDGKSMLTAVYITYLTLQMQMGKNQLFDIKNGLRKMEYLFDTIIHNLRISDTTKFNYDDMKVYATIRNNVVYISLGR